MKSQDVRTECDDELISSVPYHYFLEKVFHITRHAIHSKSNHMHITMMYISCTKVNY
jgi:hypothetical protein